MTSAKSWLGHAAVDRRAPLLPWGAEEDEPRLSPVDASRRVLARLRTAWEESHPDAPLLDQELVLTVPASFDVDARELTLEAAAGAGLAPKLLEEPQAAFTAWLRANGEAPLRALVEERGGLDVLVIDVGGGTTDLTVIRAALHEDRLTLERTAVGRHLLLGGDNMDLALAHAVERKLGKRLGPAQLGQLVRTARAAKERLLGEQPPESAPIRLLGTGSALVGSTLVSELTRAEVEALVLEGFFPLVGADELPRVGRGGLVALGLPYEADPALTRHLAAFCARHRTPDGYGAVLLNGGCFRSPRLRARVLEQLASWGNAPTLLEAVDTDLAVALGAAAHAAALASGGARVFARSARGYYVAVASDDGQRRGVCVVPRGTAERVRARVEPPGLAVRAGSRSRFVVVARDHGPIDAAGALVALTDDDTTLPPVVAEPLDTNSDALVPVALLAELTEVGTLELAWEELGGGAARAHRLSFELRGEEAARAGSVAPGAPPSVAGRRGRANLERALEAIARVFGKGRKDVHEREPRDLQRELERLLGERRLWDAELCRTLFDAVASGAKHRRRSLDHERAFFALAGFTLRPGVGAPGDEARVAMWWTAASEPLAFPAEKRGWQQLLIGLRRIAAGLDEAKQTELRDRYDAFVAPREAELKKPKGVKLQGEEELLELLAFLERVTPQRRGELGRWVLERTWTDRDPRLWLHLARLGARVPTYASAHHVVPPRVVERWLDHVVREKLAEHGAARVAARELARFTGDRARDVSEALRQEVASQLERAGDSESARVVRELLEPGIQERASAYGEELPLGLVLLNDS